jgi:hypothetical protein
MKAASTPSLIAVAKPAALSEYVITPFEPTALGADIVFGMSVLAKLGGLVRRKPLTEDQLRAREAAALARDQLRSLKTSQRSLHAPPRGPERRH